MLEALIGAIYIDCETDLQIVWDVYTRLFPLEEINKVIDIKPKHPVAELMEKFPSNVKFNTASVAKDGMVSVIVQVTIASNETLKFKGIGRNGISAKRAAAKCCLREFDKRPYREMYVNY